MCDWYICTYLPVFLTSSWTWTGSLKTSQWSHWVQTCPLTERRCARELLHPGRGSASSDPGPEPGSQRGHCTQMKRYFQPKGQQSFSHPLGTWLHGLTLLRKTVFHINSTQKEFEIISLFSFSSLFDPRCVSGFSLLFTSASLNAEREWAHCFAVTGKQLCWGSKISPWESLSQSSTLDLNPASRCTFGEKFGRIFLVLSSPVIVSLPLLFLWSTDLFLRSQVANKGGIQFKQHSLIGWFGKFGWFSYALSLLHCLLYLSGDFPTKPLSLQDLLVQNQESLISYSERHTRMASAWFRQSTHGKWVWVRVPATRW